MRKHCIQALTAASVFAAPGISHADSITVSGNHTSGVSEVLPAAPGSSITIDAAATITPPAAQNGLTIQTNYPGSAASNKFQVINNGTISVTGDTTPGSFVQTWGLYGQQLLTTVDRTPMSSVIINNGTILGRDGAQGLYAKQGWDVINRGRISIDEAPRGDALFVDTEGTAINEGYIHVGGSNMIALHGYYRSHVINRGVISGAGTGISERYDGTVENFGTIVTTGDAAAGIYAEDGYKGTFIRNAGTITTSGKNAIGIGGIRGPSLVNSGSITTTGTGSAAVSLQVSDRSSFLNSGKITTSGDNADGLRFLHSNYTAPVKQFENTGIISTSGNNAHGVHWQLSSGHFDNNGQIIVSGSGSDGIHVDRSDGYGTITGVRFNNNGSIISKTPGGMALRFTAAGNTVVFGGQSFIQGGIDLGDGTAVDFDMDRKMGAIHFDLSQGTLTGTSDNSGGAPFFFDSVSKQAATFETTGVTVPRATANLLGQNISALLQGRLSASSASSNQSSNVSTQALASPFGSMGVSRDWWASAFGSMQKIDGDSHSFDIDVSGGGLAMGHDLFVDADSTWGIFAGMSRTMAKAESPLFHAHDNDATGGFAGLYGRQDFGLAFLDFAATAGVERHKADRTINYNLGSGGLETATAHYFAWWLQPELRAGLNVDAGGWLITPSAGFAANLVHIGSADESGSTANAKTGSLSFSTLTADAQLAFSHAIGPGTLTAKFGGRYTKAGGDKSAGITIFGQEQEVDLSRYSALSGFGAVNLEIPVSPAASLVLGGEAALSTSTRIYGTNLTFDVQF